MGRSNKAPKADITHESGLSDEMVAEFKEVFLLFDKDGGGSIDEEELESVMKALGQNPTQKELTALMSEAAAYDVEIKASRDSSQDGEEEDDDDDDGLDMSMDAYLKLMAKKMKERDEEGELVQAFNEYLADEPGCGYISVTRLKVILNNLGENFSPEVIDHLLDEADGNADGKIWIDSFVKNCLEL